MPTDRRRREPASPGRRVASLAALVTRARMRAGLSQRDLAALTGISNFTIARLERGADARWDTIRDLAAHLPGITAASVLQPRSRHPPQASSAAVEALRDLFGFGAEAISQRLTVGPGAPTLETRVEGLALEPQAAEHASDEHVVTALMRVACLGSPGLRRGLEGARLLEASGALDLQEGATRHRFALRREARLTLDYRCTAPFAGAPDASSTHHVLRLPARELRLELAGPRGAPELKAWTPSSLRDRADSDLADRLHPGGMGLLLEQAGAVLRAVVAHPIVGVAYELVASEGAGPNPRAIGSPRERALEVVASRAMSLRREAGLTLREMADRVGVSFATVRELESGRAPRPSTIEAYLRAFPALAPQELLPIDVSGGSLSHDELWDYHRRVFGFCADEYEKILRVRSDGWTRMTATYRGIRADAPMDSTLSLRLAVGRAVMTDRPNGPIEKVLASSKDLRLRTIRHREDTLTHLLTFPGGLSSKGATYERRFSWKPTFRMSQEQAAETSGGNPGPYISGTSVTLPHPVRVLRLIVEFPAAFRPPEFLVHAWPEAHVPHGEAMSLLDVLPRFDHSARFDVRRSRVVLEVSKPMPDIRHAVAWTLPSRSRARR